MGKRKTTEAEFESIARNAGFTVEPGKSIRIQKPVLDKNGIRRKTVATPDFFITEPDSNQSFHVEVTDSSGDTPHKSAQKQVVISAGIKNYAVITGNHIKELQEIISPSEQKELLLHFFHLALLNY